MALRTVALYHGKPIGIETIYTVIDGKQINIKDKVEALRKKGRNNELFCPCGCGTNLELVAGDKNIREQHFRIKDGQQLLNCSVPYEGKTSKDSKIVLKCWIDDNIHASDLEARVPVSDISDNNRKYELTFVSKKYGLAIDYCYDRANLSDEKQSILEQYCRGIRIIHVVDGKNGGTNGQYPEGLMKIQNRQEYCLLLRIEGTNYEKAQIKAVFYDRDIDMLWQEIVFAEGLLREFRIENREIFYKGTPLLTLLEKARVHFQDSIREEATRREQNEKYYKEYIEQKRRQKEINVQRQIEQVKKEQEEREIAIQEKIKRDEEFKLFLPTALEQQETQVRDSDGNRWIKCEYCGLVAKDSEFSSYGGKIGVHLNLGTCRECSKNNPLVKKMRKEERIVIERNNDSMICPYCGGTLREKNGRNGRFVGCSNFPKCRFTRSIGE